MWNYHIVKPTSHGWSSLPLFWNGHILEFAFSAYVGQTQISNCWLNYLVTSHICMYIYIYHMYVCIYIYIICMYNMCNISDILTILLESKDCLVSKNCVPWRPGDVALPRAAERSRWRDASCDGVMGIQRSQTIRVYWSILVYTLW